MVTATAKTPEWASALLDVWFRQLGPQDWFQSSNNVDALLISQFEVELARQAAFPAAYFLDDARQFAAMPLMHSESLADQEASLAYFTAYLPGNVPFARHHRDAIARFGRFPHRNAILGRETTQAEAKAIADGMIW